MEPKASRISSYLFVIGLIGSLIAGVLVHELYIGSVGQAWISVVFVVIGLVIGFFMPVVKKSRGRDIHPVAGHGSAVDR